MILRIFCVPFVLILLYLILLPWPQPTWKSKVKAICSMFHLLSYSSLLDTSNRAGPNLLVYKNNRNNFSLPPFAGSNEHIWIREEENIFFLRFFFPINVVERVLCGEHWNWSNKARKKKKEKQWRKEERKFQLNKEEMKLRKNLLCLWQCEIAERGIPRIHLWLYEFIILSFLILIPLRPPPFRSPTTHLIYHY